MVQAISRYEVLQAHMRGMAADPAMQRSQSAIESNLRRWAEDKGIDTMALVDCAMRDVPLDQALTLANVTRKRSDTLLEPLTPYLVSLVKSLLPLSTALNQHEG